jgi:hypothetical protein
MAQGVVMARGGARTGAGRPIGTGVSFSRETIDRIRAKIQTDKLIQRLEDLACGAIEMPPHAVTAALGLLRKVMPDTATVEHSGEIATTKVIRSPSVNDTAKAWAAEHVPEQHTEH